MLFLRWVVLLALLSAAVSFGCFAITGQARYKRYGLQVLKWTLVAAFAFFGVLILERVG